MPGRKWTRAEQATLKRLAPKMTALDIARKLKRSRPAVHQQAQDLGIHLTFAPKVKVPGKNAQPPEAESQTKTIERLAHDLSKYRQREGDYAVLSEKLGDFAKKMPVPRQLHVKGKPADRAQEMVALFSDAHACEFWQAEQTDGLSSYSFEDFCRYIWHYADVIGGFARDFRPLYGVKKLHVDFLGDIIHGTLRLDDEATNDYGTVKGVALTSSVLFQWLTTLLEHFEAIECRCMAGNHGRLHKKPQSKRYVGENLDTLIYSNLALMTRAAKLNARLNIIIPGSRTFTFDRLGHRIKIGHGDHIRGGNSIANIPIYGLSRDILRKYRQDAKAPEASIPSEVSAAARQGLALMEYGHFHNSTFLEDVLFMNGSIAPADPYATDDLGAVSQQKQWVYFSSREHAYGWSMPVSLKSGRRKPHGFEYDETIAGSLAT